MLFIAATQGLQVAPDFIGNSAVLSWNTPSSSVFSRFSEYCFSGRQPDALLGAPPILVGEMLPGTAPPMSEACRNDYGRGRR